jgi:Heterokaryon incompatibility protein (HET)
MQTADPTNLYENSASFSSHTEGVSQASATTPLNPSSLRYADRHRPDLREAVRSQTDPPQQTARVARVWDARVVRTTGSQGYCKVGEDVSEKAKEYYVEHRKFLCNVCKIEVYTAPSDRTSFPWAVWTKSAHEGCRSCAVIVEGVRRLAWTFGLNPERFHIAKITENKWVGVGETVVKVAIFWVDEDGGDREEEVEFQFRRLGVDEDGDGKKADKEPRYESEAKEDVSINDLFGSARRLLQTCGGDHPSCRRPISGFRPTRLIDLSGCEDTVSVRLVHSECLLPSIPIFYVALSYCWGQVLPLRLLKSSLGDFERDIGYDKLPKLFQDAVTFTRYLGIRYLWIDALCIIQDDAADWERESERMGQIYYHSHVTVGATSCRDTSESLLKLSLQRILITNLSSEYISPITARTTGGDMTFPLHYRAWAYQELLLPLRYLDFDSKGLQLHCCHGTTTAISQKNTKSNATNGPRDQWTAQEYLKPDFRQPWQFRWLWSRLLRLKEQEGSSTAVGPGHDDLRPSYLKCLNIASVWTEIVTMYTNRRLTFSSDLLPALSGLAATYLSCFGSDDSYYAGLWRKCFIQHLAWTSSSEATPGPVYRAPSWSWASLYGSVDYCAVNAFETYFHKSGEKMQTRLEGVSCVLKGRNPFGEVTEGFAILRGPAYRCVLVWDPGDQYRIEGLNANWFPHTLSIDVEVHGSDIKLELGNIVKSARRAQHRGHGWVFRRWEVLALHLYDLGSGDGIFLILGMVSANPEAYERIGLLRTQTRWGWGRNAVDVFDKHGDEVQSVKIV